MNIRVRIEAVTATANRADDVFETGNLGTKATNVNVDGSIIGCARVVGVPNQLHQLSSANGLSLILDQVGE